jgi:hypothetical protein
MPSSLRSKIQSPPANRSCVSVAAIGSTQSGNGAAIVPWHYSKAGGLHMLRALVLVKGRVPPSTARATLAR